ncbi:MAG TPA: hypothetical protein VD862_02310 [Candidatus Paceibacterota bacterium]|nr:hypothetical protein [Candidatus Paceibacterota bacterium]
MLIIKIPAPRPVKSGAVDPKVQRRILEYLDARKSAESEDVVGDIARDVLLDRFGYGLYQGRTVALRALQLLEKDGALTCEFTGAKATVTRKQPEPSAAAKPRAVHRPVPAVPAPVKRKKYRGPAWHARKAERRGEHNEDRFHQLMKRLADILRASFPDVVRSVRVSRSRRHDPLSGMPSVRDHMGDDVSLRLRSPGPRGNRWLIYDVKSSRAAAWQFAGNIRKTGYQEKASLKTSIVVNNRRTDSEIVGDVLDDLVRVHFMDRDAAQRILGAFGESAS